MQVAAEAKLPYLGTNGFPLQSGAVYGPIHSRRYGYSLGINPLPVSYKLCDFDCVYCQYGWTPKGVGEERTDSGEKKPREKFKPAALLLQEIEEAFQKVSSEHVPIRVITIAGNGEPTLHPEFPELVDSLLELRTRYFRSAPLGILSDASQCHRTSIKDALEKLDERCMKLDAGDSETIQMINRPRGDFRLERTVEALKNLKDVTLQAMFLTGSYDNTHEEQVKDWIDRVQYVSPMQVQVYTIDRPPADSKILAVETLVLQKIAEQCYRQTGIPTEVF